eukprot:TRINITY_DN15328_c0_g2_i14.p1 TRINITY_DN15328_c0_g2~~TRINITY_DN15328_c0_g2_i14.p1  ORF type:complete len:173 (-),score=18.73 TRINITY_DN15328_c0_g2_i14:513-1031(-)
MIPRNSQTNRNIRLTPISRADPNRTFFVRRLRSKVKSKTTSAIKNSTQNKFSNNTFEVRAVRVRRLRRIDRLLNTINNISLLYTKPSPTSHRSNPMSVARTRNTTLAKKTRNKELCDEEKMKKLVDNDSSYFIEDITSVKQNLILGSMRTTFLCSNYCRFQPLLNVFECHKC